MINWPIEEIGNNSQECRTRGQFYSSETLQYMETNAFQNKKIMHHSRASHYFGWHDNTDGQNNGSLTTLQSQTDTNDEAIQDKLVTHQVNQLLKCARMFLLHLDDLLPCLEVGEFVIPFCHILLVSEKLSSSFSIYDVVRVWKVRKVSQGEFITSQVLILGEYFFINIKDLLQFILIFSNNSRVLTNAQMTEMRNECQLKDKCRARRAKVLSFRLKPLFYWCPF